MWILILLEITGGAVMLLQLLDTDINWPFKVTFQQLYNHWMSTMKHELTPSGRLKPALLMTVCE
jgi:hypothetical protein